MPVTPLRPCNRCKALTRQALCPDCQAKVDKEKSKTRQKADRRTKQERPHDSTAWKKLRLMHRRRFPFCHDCQAKGKIKPADVVHHIISVEDYPDGLLDMANLMSLCRDCHEIRHGRMKSKGPAYSLDGLPIDPEHHWNNDKEKEQ